MQAVCPNEADYLRDNLQMPLPAISLMNAVALNSAFANDQAPDLAMAQQVLGLARPEDIFIGISTSGNSANVIYAIQMAKTLGTKNHWSHWQPSLPYAESLRYLLLLHQKWKPTRFRSCICQSTICFALP